LNSYFHLNIRHSHTSPPLYHYQSPPFTLTLSLSLDR
jgi:hypothetical protein